MPPVRGQAGTDLVAVDGERRDQRDAIAGGRFEPARAHQPGQHRAGGRDERRLHVADRHRALHVGHACDSARSGS